MEQPSGGTSVKLGSWNEELAVLKEAPWISQMKALLLDRLGFDDHRMVCWKIDQPALSCILMVVRWEEPEEDSIAYNLTY
ncbi:hypothetical protein H5410_048235 [Solanum commersonii]|uniref:Uncharacterized protein n=1 Tax=Solanum commersonii TaxID=4109 RepID=A0A9J5XHI4_SOLCO|nr:hypothetical protein H5410_048235 [Solanum commersonii]